MKRIIKLTESDLARIVKRVIREQKSEDTPKDDRFCSCSKIGVKYAGLCDRKTKKPVESCSKLGVKTPGYCYLDKTPVK